MNKRTEIIAVPSFGNEIIWEKNIIRLPFDTSDERDKKIYEWITALQNKVEKLEKERGVFTFNRLTDSQARARIIEYLKNKK